MSVRVNNFNTWYGTTQILKDINIDFKECMITAIVGPSGCGKTTLLKSINRTAELDRGFVRKGEVLLAGENIYESSNVESIRRRCGLVLQTPVALPLSIKENILFGPRYYGVKKEMMNDITEQCLRQAGLWDEVKDKLHRPATELSGGQKQRLSIARALAAKPQVLLLDEPCSSLDPSSTMLIESLLQHLAEKLTVILVTHNLFQAKRVAGEIVFMMDGRVVEQGSKDIMFSDPKLEETRAFFSGSIG